MRPFLFVWSQILDAETRQYHNVPGDPGRGTKFGITERDFPPSRIALILSYPKAVKDLTEDEARTIFQKEYWEKVRADELDGELAIALVDCAYNQGAGTAIILLQRTLKLPTDGRFGPMTMAAVRRWAPRQLLVEFLGHRALRYAQGDPQFMRGWFNRLFELTLDIGDYKTGRT